MCTPACESSYKNDFDYLRQQTVIPSDNSIYQKLQGKQNLTCVRAFLTEMAPKVQAR